MSKPQGEHRAVAGLPVGHAFEAIDTYSLQSLDKIVFSPAETMVDIVGDTSQSKFT